MIKSRDGQVIFKVVVEIRLEASNDRLTIQEHTQRIDIHVSGKGANSLDP
jgi:hypothetical protein